MEITHKKNIITVRVVAGARTEKVEEIAPFVFKIRVKEPPEKGKVNKRIVKLLAEYYSIPVTHIHLTHGATHREKLFMIIFSSFAI